MGHSSDVPPGQGTKQFDVASSKLLPQYNEPGEDEDGSIFEEIGVGSLFGALGVGSLSGKSTQDVKE